MFKTRFTDTYSEHFSVQNPYRYQIECEVNGFFLDGRLHFHTAEFKDKKKAFTACKHFDEFFENVFFLADTFYYRILSLPDYEVKIKQIDYTHESVLNEVTRSRTKILLNNRVSAFAHQYIDDLFSFINNVLLLIPYYYRTHTQISAMCFSVLTSLKEGFKVSYRNYCVSLNPQDLRLLCK